MEELILNRVQGPGFASGIATGASVAGPTSDGMIHITFFRDVAKVTSERLEVEKMADDSLRPTGKQQLESTIYREEVATISLPIHVAKGLSSWVNDHMSKVEAHSNGRD